MTCTQQGKQVVEKCSLQGMRINLVRSGVEPDCASFSALPEALRTTMTQTSLYILVKDLDKRVNKHRLSGFRVSEHEVCERPQSLTSSDYFMALQRRALNCF